LDLAEALVAAGDIPRSLAVLSALKADESLTRALRYRAASLEAGIEFQAGHLQASTAAVKQAVGNATDDGDERLAKLKLRALADARAQESLGRVAFGDERGRPIDPGLVVFLVTEFARAFPGEALGPYLVGRQLSWRDPGLAAAYFATACPFAEGGLAVPLDGVFLKECRRQWGESAYLAGDLTTARAGAAWVAEHAEREADRLRARDFLSRIAWKASR
jgi:hypothetical protein